MSVRDVVDDSLEARRALRALASLTGRQRQYAVLRVAGFSYREIAARQGVTYTNVNKHLTKASRRLKDAAEHAA
ncbi:MAG TPA: sigma factor-like helix-turn-helix DNA-binding protein [Solirubrobacteraceae bacterium]|nr:sigma factor-like helix-turn-helix DNA-binding protein [Solirubrobacteraceae bacterium]